MPQPTIKSNNLPPNGIYPATIHLISSERGLKITFEVQANGKVIQLDCPVILESEKGRRFLSMVRRAAGLGSSADDERINGKKVKVLCCGVLVKGVMRWKIREVLGAHTPTSTAGNQEPVLEPDNLDELVDRMLRHLPEARFASEGEDVLLIRPGHSPVRIDPKCDEYAKLQHELTGLGTVETDGKIVTQRLKLRVLDQAMKFRRVFFSLAMSHQVCIPVEGRSVLRITSSGFELEDNGRDDVWLEHPKDQPMPWSSGLDPREGLKLLEEKLLEALAIRNRALRYLLMAATLLFVWVRQLSSMRPIVQASGKDGAGKTTNSQRILSLLALGKAKGDYSVARLQRDRDHGLIVIDNVESSDLPKLVNYFLFAAADSEWARVGEKANSERPVIIVTSIEGIGVTGELARRLLKFHLERDKSTPFDERDLLAEIEAARPAIFRGIAEVLQLFLSQSPVPVPKVIPMPDFTDYCYIIYRLLHAFGEATQKPQGFADAVFDEWVAERNKATEEAPDSAGPYPRLLEAALSEDGSPNLLEPVFHYRYKEFEGTLYVGTGTAFLTLLKRALARERGTVTLPENPEGLRNRLRALRPEHGFIFVTANEDPNCPQLKRRATGRYWGILWLERSADG